MEENGVKAFQLRERRGLSSGAGVRHRTHFAPGGAISSSLRLRFTCVAPLRNLRNRGAAASGERLDGGPRLLGGEHGGDPVVALGILGSALVATQDLCLCLALHLSATAIIVVL